MGDVRKCVGVGEVRGDVGRGVGVRKRAGERCNAKSE